MAATAPERVPRQDNRRQHLLDAAAGLICRRGYHGTSMRDIGRASDMLAGSIYYHFPSKDALLVAVYAEGVRRIAERVDAAVSRGADPMKRLEAAKAALAQRDRDAQSARQMREIEAEIARLNATTTSRSAP